MTAAKHQKSDAHLNYESEVELHLDQLSSKKIPLSYLVNNFAKYSNRYQITKFMARYDLYRRILPIKGSIVECGVLSGNGLMSWARLSSILEPVAFNRRIFGFDTFDGFPEIHAKDKAVNFSWSKGDLRDSCYDELQECIRLYDIDRFISHINKVNLIKGDFLLTADKFLMENPHVLVALLYLDFDLYEPTKKALEVFLPRMSKGSVLCFDEINNPKFPGETLAMLEKLNLRDFRIEKFEYDPNMAYIVL